MQRTIVQPADLTGDALAEFKSWLGISRPNEDELLVSLLEASLAMCEAFTGQVPLEQMVEERVPAAGGKYCLTSHPVTVLSSAEVIAQDGMRTPAPEVVESFVIEAAGRASVLVADGLQGQAVAVRMIVGIAADWPSMPKALRQGIIRLAAFYYRDRDQNTSAQPPASVTALWRPWRIVRLT